MTCAITFTSASGMSAEDRARFTQEGAVFTQPDPTKHPEWWEVEPFQMEFGTVDELVAWLRKMGQAAMIDGDGDIEIYNWYRE